jgi:hypothetical protein
LFLRENNYKIFRKNFVVSCSTAATQKHGKATRAAQESIQSIANTYMQKKFVEIQGYAPLSL